MCEKYTMEDLLPLIKKVINRLDEKDSSGKTSHSLLILLYQILQFAIEKEDGLYWSVNSDIDPPHYIEFIGLIASKVKEEKARDLIKGFFGGLFEDKVHVDLQFKNNA